MKKRILAVALALATLLSIFAVGAFAATPEEQAEILLEQTRATLNSGKYTLKARGTSPGGNPMPVVFAVDGERWMFETTMDWVSMLREMGANKVRDTLFGWAMQLFFGKKVRFITERSQALIVFVNRRIYAVVPDSPDLLDIDITAVFDIPDLTGMTVTEPTVGGKKYLCATLENDDGIAISYYYLNGALKRIAIEDAVIEIDSLSASVDQSYFSTKWMWKLTFKLFNLF